MNITIKRLLLGCLVLVAIVGGYFIMVEDGRRAEQRAAFIEQTPERNKESIKNEEIMGVTNDGQEIKRVTVEYVNDRCKGCGTSIETHYIYFVGKAVTDNAIIPSGKSTRIEPRVTIKE
jgi:hypothetical protein